MEALPRFHVIGMRILKEAAAAEGLAPLCYYSYNKGTAVIVSARSCLLAALPVMTMGPPTR
jgi:hypothetical protein